MLQSYKKSSLFSLTQRKDSEDLPCKASLDGVSWEAYLEREGGVRSSRGCKSLLPQDILKAPEAHLRHIVLLNIDDMSLVRVRPIKATYV